MNNKGKLYLIPTIIADNTQGSVLPPQVMQVLPSVRHFLAEDLRTARRFLSSLKIYQAIEDLSFEVLNKDTNQETLPELFAPIEQGHHLGVLSESGCPGVADPGAVAVVYAHTLGIDVIPLVGPSSILLALMASGLNGQRFAFHGYLPVNQAEAASVIKALEKESRQKYQTQIFIETPYRNNTILAALLKSLSGTTRLTIAVDITGVNQFIRTKPVGLWKKEHIALPKLPAVFLFLA